LHALADAMTGMSFSSMMPDRLLIVSREIHLLQAQAYVYIRDIGGSERLPRRPVPAYVGIGTLRNDEF